MDDGRDEPVVRRDRDRDVDAIALDQRSVAPAAVDAWVAAQGLGADLDEQIRRGKIGAAGTLSRNGAPREKACRVDLAPQVEMRHLLPALGRVPRHGAPDGTRFLPVAGCSFDVGCDNGAVRPATAKGCEVDPVYLRKLPRLGRREVPPAIAALRSPYVSLPMRRCGRNGSGLRHDGRLGRRFFARGENHGDDAPDRDIRAFGHTQPRQRPTCGRLDLDGHLVRFDLHDRRALLDLLTLVLEPAQHLAGFLRDSERGHDHVRRHQDGSSAAPSSREPSTTASTGRTSALLRLDCDSRVPGSGPRAVG